MEKNNMAREINRVVAATGWAEHVGFKYDAFDGYRDQTFGFGYCNNNQWFFLAHEMAHACVLKQAELDRLSFFSFGLKFPEIEICGHIVCEPQTMQMTELECRVFGIQKHIMESFIQAGACDVFVDGIDEYENEAARTMIRFMPDWWYGGSTDDERKKTRVSLIRTSYDSINLNEIKKRWKTVCQYLEALPPTAQETN